MKFEFWQHAPIFNVYFITLNYTDIIFVVTKEGCIYLLGPPQKYKTILKRLRSYDCSVGIMIRVLARQPKGGNKFCCFPKRPNWFSDPPSLLLNENQKESGGVVKRTTHHHLPQRFGINGAVPSLPREREAERHQLLSHFGSAPDVPTFISVDHPHTANPERNSFTSQNARIHRDIPWQVPYSATP